MNETLTAIAGVQVGHAHDSVGLTGCTVVRFNTRCRASVSLAGGSPGTYNIGAALTTWQGVECDAIFLAGGSLYGLDAATGVRQYVEETRIAQQSKRTIDPQSLLGGIVAGAVIFDLLIGSATARPDAAMGHTAAANASTLPVAEGNVGVGCGATVGKFLGPKYSMKGGVGSVCLSSSLGFQVGALVVVNALGNIFDLAQGRTLAGTRSLSGSGFIEFTNAQETFPSTAAPSSQHTTLGVIVTDVDLDALLLSKLAAAGQDGMIRAIRQAHTSLDGDTFFSVTTAAKPLPKATPLFVPDAIIHLASEAVRLAILRAVQAARSVGPIPGLAGS